MECFHFPEEYRKDIMEEWLICNEASQIAGTTVTWKLTMLNLKTEP